MINVTNLSVTINKNPILKEVNAHFKQGTCYGLIGRNGSGKSVFFKAITGFIPVDSGEILVNQQVVKPQTFIDGMGVIIEAPNFIPSLSAFRNLLCLAEIQKKISKETILETLKKVGLEEVTHKKYKHFSLGMKQRLRIAQAIMENPAIYILDEPFNGLDEQGVQDIYHIIQALKNEGKTILLTSHGRTDIETLCDVILEVKDGSLHEI